MNRRNFLSTGIGAGALAAFGSSAARADVPAAAGQDWRAAPALQKALHPRPLQVTSGLETYKAGAALGEADARHLLQRVCFQYSAADLAKAQAMTAAEAIGYLLDGNSFSTPELPDWAAEAPLSRTEIAELTAGMTPEERQEFIQQLTQQFFDRTFELQSWWTKVLMNCGFDNASAPYNGLREKMTFFWHNHFTSEATTVRIPQYMAMQNNWLRAGAFGNFRTLARESVSDPAMLIYLDGNTNVNGKPNENFAREILELFTLGEGNYSEQDIIEAARAFTGWQPFKLGHAFFPGLHDFGSKTMFGVRFENPRSEAGGIADTDKVIELIFAQRFDRPGDVYDGKSIAAVFLAEKLYRFFVYEYADRALCANLADVLEQNNFELAPALRSLLSSAHFYDAEFRGALLKSPLDFMIGLVRQFPMNALPPTDNGDRRSLSFAFVSYASSLGLTVFDPPNVAGWPGYREWINTVSFPQRNFYSDLLANGFPFGRPPQTVGIRARDFAERFPSFTPEVGAFVDEVAAYLLPFALSAKQRSRLIEQTLDGAPDYEWQNIVADEASAVPRIQNLIREVLGLPEYQLA